MDVVVGVRKFVLIFRKKKKALKFIADVDLGRQLRISCMKWRELSFLWKAKEFKRILRFQQRVNNENKSKNVLIYFHQQEEEANYVTLLFPTCEHSEKNNSGRLLTVCVINDYACLLFAFDRAHMFKWKKKYKILCKHFCSYA